MALDRRECVLAERVDVVEINHLYDEDMRFVYDQIIYYDYNPTKGRYDVVDWRLVKTEGQIPLRDWRSGDFVSIWHDFKEHDVLRKVLPRSIRETWTQEDPEKCERDLLPNEKRRRLRKSPRLMAPDDPKIFVPRNVTHAERFPQQN